MNVRRGITSILGAAFLVLMAGMANATVLLSENFDDVSLLPGAGWAIVNNSNPLGTSDWFQGNGAIFPAHQGADDSYVAANYLSADPLGGNVSDWLLLPTLGLQNGDTLTFYTRTEAGSIFPDRLEVRLSTNGSSTDVGNTDASVGDFGALLLTINPTLALGGYPEDWTAFSVVLSGLSGTTDGRLAFRYFVPDTTTNANYIGIDTLTIERAAAAPEPSSVLLLLFAAATARSLSQKRRLL